MGSPFKRGCQNLNLTKTHEIFSVGKYEEKFYPNEALRNSNFLTFQAGHVKWWSTNSQLPCLKQLASKYFRIPATSFFSERCFSTLGLTVSELRTQLGGEHVEASNVMHCNKVLL